MITDKILSYAGAGLAVVFALTTAQQAFAKWRVERKLSGAIVSEARAKQEAGAALASLEIHKQACEAITRENRAAFAEALADQSASIEAIRQAGLDAAVIVSQAAARAQRVAATSQARIERIDSAKIAPVCEAALAFLREVGPGLVPEFRK